jgi:cell division protein FtsI/penicillin-binding protein 2
MAALMQLHSRTAQAVCCTLLALSGVLLPAQQSAQSPNLPTLFAQATSTMLDREFPSPRVDYLLLDLRTGQTVAIRWPHADTPIPVGSLLKPFVALAYNQLHASPANRAEFPIVQCHGKSDGCWRPGGHGSLALEHALAQSCNTYFLTLARDIFASGAAGTEALNRVSAAYGLPPPPVQTAPATLIGLGPEWRIAPLDLAHAYARLAIQSQAESQVEPEFSPQAATRLLAGMKLAAQPGGTASRIAALPGGVLAKTGTAPCIPGLNPEPNRCTANNDGLAIVLFPSDSPRLLTLVRQRGTTGAQAAELAGKMLTRLQNPAPK